MFDVQILPYYCSTFTQLVSAIVYESTQLFVCLLSYVNKHFSYQ